LLMWGDVIKNTTTVRSGGAASSLEVVPLSNCSVIAPIPIFEWTELAVPASAQNKSVYMRADAAWSVYPTADELYVEAEYISDGTTFAVAIVKSTAVLNHASNWIQFTIPEFTPAVAGSVRYRAYLKKYEADRKVYVDNMLVAA
jgi:superoxide dismutase